MGKKETLGFKVECEWLCDFVRQRIFYEEMSFNWGVETLKKSFGISEEIATQIITGTKTIKGVNSGELVDCNKTKEYLDYMKREEEDKLKAELEVELDLHPIKYVDPFATKYSYRYLKEQIELYGHPSDMKALRRYFQKEPANNDWLFEGGLYSVSLEFVNKKIQTEEDTQEFWKKLYDYWNTQLTSSYLCYTDSDVREIKLRQRNYEMYLEKEKRKSSFSKDQMLKLARELSPNMALNKNNEYTFCDGAEFRYQQQGKYIPLKEGVFSTYGLISPEGDFYSCDFASHHIAAYVICQQNAWIDENPFDKLGGGDPFGDLGYKAKDLLYGKGWVFVRTNGAGTFYSKWDELENMPQKQMDTAYDYIVWERNQSKGD